MPKYCASRSPATEPERLPAMPWRRAKSMAALPRTRRRSAPPPARSGVSRRRSSSRRRRDSSTRWESMVHRSGGRTPGSISPMPAVVRSISSSSSVGSSKPSPSSRPVVVIGRDWTNQTRSPSHAHSTSCGAPDSSSTRNARSRAIDSSGAVPPRAPTRGRTTASGVSLPDTRDSARPSTTSMRARDGAPPGSTVNTTPARRAGTIGIRTTAIAASSSLMPKLRR